MRVVITLQGVRPNSPEPKAEKPRILSKDWQSEKAVRYSANVSPGQLELLMIRLEAKIRHYRPDEVEILMGIAPTGEFPVNQFYHAYHAHFDGLAKELQSVTSTLRTCTGADSPVESKIRLYYE